MSLWHSCLFVTGISTDFVKRRKKGKFMLKKATASILSFVIIMVTGLSLTTVSAAQFAEADEFYINDEETGLDAEEEEIYLEEESIEEFFSGDEGFAGEEFLTGEAAFSDGDDSFTDIEDTSFEKTLEVTEGEDITEKLNAALLEMKEKATDTQMCKVIIPPGNYVITGTICMYSNIHLYAEGAVITKMSPVKQVMLRLGNSTESKGGYDGYRNIVIEGGTWDANYETIPDKEADGGFVDFRIGHASNVEIKNVTFLNNLKSHFLELGGVKNAKITGCTFRGYWESYTGGGQEAIQIDACRDYIFPGYLPYDGTVCEDIYIEGNTFEHVFAGVGSHSMIFDRPYKNIVIRGNVFREITRRAVWCLNYVDSVVENNVMINVGAGVYVRSIYSKNTHLPDGEAPANTGNQYNANVVIVNNEIVLNEPKVIGDVLWKSFGVGLVGEKVTESESSVPGGRYPVQGVTIKNNKISGAGNGIRLALADKCRIADNVLELSPTDDFDNYGIILGASSSNTISGNRIKGSKGRAIYLYKGSAEYNEPSENNVVAKNTVTECATDGIVVGRSSGNTKVEKNILKGLAGNGICVMQNSGALISGNTVDNCEKNGILVSSSKKASIIENKISGSVIDGIKSEEINTGLVVKRNNTSRNKGAGMCLVGAHSVSVSENEIVSNKINGISLRSSENAALTKNTIKNNKGYAVIGTNSSVKIYSGNRLKGNGHTDTIYAINTSLPYSVKKSMRK